MKTTLIAALLMFSVSFAVRADNDPKKQEMMKEWMKYSTPGAEHKVLAGMAGKWKYTSKSWQTANSTPEESTGTSTMKMIMGGRFLEQEVKGKAMGMNFEGMGIVGYDNLKGKYETSWIDNMATGAMHGTATFDSSTKTLTDTGSFSCPMTPTKTMNYRTEWKMADANNSTFTMFTPGADGKEFKMMELVYKRAK